jgi:hypothetical protein
MINDEVSITENHFSMLKPKVITMKHENIPFMMLVPDYVHSLVDNLFAMPI